MLLRNEVFMKNCPCCSNQLLRHFRHHQIYWFCQSCRQEMPLLEQPSLSRMSLMLEQDFALLVQPDRRSLSQA
jgi:ribosomal protein L37AE/L43A